MTETERSVVQSLEGGSDAVCVAVHIRPLVESELADGCQTCLSVTPGQPQVVCKDGPTFTYDYVYGGGGASPDRLYDQCVQPLVVGLFKGYNACCFAYGQTGSGKTYTMGSSAFTATGSARGVIPCVMESIFDRIAATGDAAFTVRVGFVEIFNEEIRDLLSPDQAATAAASPSVHIREVVGGGVCLAGAHEKDVTSKEEMAAILEQGSRCRATASTGMNQRSSRSHAIFTITVEQRRIAPNRAPDQAEGDHSGDDEDGAPDDYLCAKMHLVDLAGSERQKRTKAEGARLKEGININMGLLALGNVVNALTENKAHIPYRDSKLTRMLQDSLGGNSKTTMIACVSPADINLEESTQTLRYANRARNIRNKPVVNRDPIAAQISHLRQQLATARAENTRLRRRVGETEGDIALEGQWSGTWQGTPGDDVLAAALEETEARASSLDLENARLRLSLERAKGELQETHEALITARVERDRNALRLQQLGHAPGRGKENAYPQVGGPPGGGDGVGFAGGTGGTAAALPDQDGGGEVGFIRGYLDRIAHLEKEIRRLKEVQRCSGAFLMSARRASMGLGSPGSALKGALPGTPIAASPFPMSPFAGHSRTLAFGLATPAADQTPASDGELGDLAGDEEYAAEEHAHRVQQAKREEQLAALQKAMEAKEATWQRLNGGQGKISQIKARFDQELAHLQAQRDELQAERSQLIRSMERVKEASFEERHKMEKAYKERLKTMDGKLREVREKERRIAQMERLQARSLEKCSRLQSDILSIKQQKVLLARQIEQNAKDFAAWRKNRERELAQLRKQGRKQQMQVQKLEALQAKQAAVLRRKTEEAEAARRRLKDIMDVHRASNEKRERAASMSKSGSGVECQPNAAAPLLRDEKSRRDWIEHELDMCCQSFELARVLEGEKAQRGEVAKKLADLNRRLAHASAVGDESAAAGLEPERATLDSQLQRHSAHILETQAALARAQAEEEGRAGVSNPAEVRRWTGLRTIVEARSLLKSLFRVAAGHKAQVYEAGNALVEAREEAELLRLHLELAQQEEAAAKRALAEAQAALAAALAAPDDDIDDEAQSAAQDDVDAEAESLMEELEGIGSLEGVSGSPLLESLNEEARLGAGARSDLLARYEDASAESLESASSDGSIADDSADDGDSDESDDYEWDPSLATPAAGVRRRVRSGSRRCSRSSAVSALTRGRLGSCAGSGGLAATPSTQERCATAVRESREEPVLLALNAERRRAGAEPLVKLTVPALKAHLKGKWVGGQEWRPGSKKRSELIDDYRQFMGLDVQRTGPSRPLRTLSESPADDLAAANDAGAAAAQLPPMPDMSGGAQPRLEPNPPQQRFMQSPVAKQYREQCSAALRRCHNIQLRINDLRSEPASLTNSPAKPDGGEPSPHAQSAQLPGHSTFTIPALPPRGVPSQGDESSRGGSTADTLGQAFRRLSTEEEDGGSAENGSAPDLAVTGHRMEPASRQHSAADEASAQPARYGGASAGASPSRHPVSYAIDCAASLPASPAPPLPRPARPTGESTGEGVLEAKAQPCENQSEQQQQQLPPLKPKRILLSSQQAGLRPPAPKASPRILPAWV